MFESLCSEEQQILHPFMLPRAVTHSFSIRHVYICSIAGVNPSYKDRSVVRMPCNQHAYVKTTNKENKINAGTTVFAVAPAASIAAQALACARIGKYSEQSCW